jgi:outer membrane lipoprotein SlyB
MAHVLSSVPGTVEASDAVLLSQIPTTVVVNRAEAEAQAKATYDGDPKFSPIQGTKLEYATNTQDKVIKSGDLYYMCYQAVWFVSSSPQGPWKTADSVPAEIYSIPPSSPVYNVTYVTQVNPTETTVESSYTGGYLGAFIIGAAVGTIVDAAIVYGTGWYYHPYVYWPPAAIYPIYRPWPYTYGGGAVYNPWTGGWATGRRVYGPYGSAGASAWYNPATGRYGRSASVQGWYGGRSAANTYNPWTGTYGHTSQAHNPYAQWGHSVVSNGSEWARSAHVTTAHGSGFAYQTSGGREGVITRGPAGNVHGYTNNKVYAGHDGNVYKRDANGSWTHYDNTKKQWQNSNIGSTEQHRPVEKQARENVGTVRQNRGAVEHKQPVTEPTHRISGAVEHPNIGTVQQRPAASENVFQGLNRSENSRMRGETQTQRFQGVRERGGGFSGRRR